MIVYSGDSIQPSLWFRSSLTCGDWATFYPDRIISSNNDQSRAIELDLVEERRDRAAIRMEAYRSRVMKSYNKHVRSQDFQVGDLVMKKVKPVGDVGKLEAKWEGPFKIARRVRSGAAYYLENSQ
ncbi:uncharacterized protein LOC142521994 [Primulina tabacum]|uniref:uncharacterized protein LOC142521994 n=1 Tax=Primulina tabacum TaxID=48773 RepID=UPI003F5A9BBA